MFANVFQNKTVWLSGHTGFKGAWLACWLIKLGARVHGFALPPATNPSIFEQLGLVDRITHELNDIRDPVVVNQSIDRVQPDFVFHLAAQALVRNSYEYPLETIATNTMGTAHVLEALRYLKKPCAAVMVTTDKCYENRELDHAYVEEDHLGGYDPYSASKGAAEIVIGGYRRSYFGGHSVRIASARAGNVIGGGDWSLDRIVPDAMRSLQLGKSIPVRNPGATRPWQHVLEPLSGYLWLATVLNRPELIPATVAEIAGPFNFGPEKESNRTVESLVEEVLKHWPGKWENQSNPAAVHEARLLMLSTAKAKQRLQWHPTWNFPTAIARTTDWYRKVHEQGNAAVESLTLAQISEYEHSAQAAKLAWATN